MFDIFLLYILLSVTYVLFEYHDNLNGNKLYVLFKQNSKSSFLTFIKPCLNVKQVIMSWFSKYDLTLECENDAKLPYVLFGGEKKTKGKQTDFQRVLSEKHL